MNLLAKDGADLLAHLLGVRGRHARHQLCCGNLKFLRGRSLELQQGNGAEGGVDEHVYVVWRTREANVQEASTCQLSWKAFR